MHIIFLVFGQTRQGQSFSVSILFSLCLIHSFSLSFSSLGLLFSNFSFGFSSFPVKTISNVLLIFITSIKFFVNSNFILELRWCCNILCHTWFWRPKMGLFHCMIFGLQICFALSFLVVFSLYCNSLLLDNRGNNLFNTNEFVNYIYKYPSVLTSF